MKTLSLLFSLICCLPVTAQNGAALRVEPAEINKVIRVDNIDEDFEDVSAVVVTNNSNRTVQLLRENVIRESPRSWSYRALDRVQRATPYVISDDGSSSEGRQIGLQPGQSATFFIVLRPEGVAGSGTAELRFSDLTIPGTVLATATINTTLTRDEPAANASESSGSNSGTMRLYPNPAVDRFFIEVPRSVRIGRVEITNTLGRQIKTYSGAAGSDGYNIENLPDGLYLIAVYDENGKKLRTMRLLHRRFGA